MNGLRVGVSNAKFGGRAQRKARKFARPPPPAMVTAMLKNHLAARGYRVERSVDVSDPTKWSEVISFEGSGSAVTVPLGPPFSRRWFYRVVVSLN